MDSSDLDNLELLTEIESIKKELQDLEQTNALETECIVSIEQELGLLKERELSTPNIKDLVSRLGTYDTFTGTLRPYKILDPLDVEVCCDKQWDSAYSGLYVESDLEDSGVEDNIPSDFEYSEHESDVNENAMQSNTALGVGANREPSSDSNVNCDKTESNSDNSDVRNTDKNDDCSRMECQDDTTKS